MDGYLTDLVFIGGTLYYDLFSGPTDGYGFQRHGANHLKQPLFAYVRVGLEKPTFLRERLSSGGIYCHCHDRFRSGFDAKNLTCKSIGEAQKTCSGFIGYFY